MAKATSEVLHLDGHEVAVSNPGKIYFPRVGISKLELVQYYLAVAEGALRGVARRPQILKRFVNGVEAEPFFQKRIAEKRPAWIETAVFTFPSGRHAEEIVVNQRAQLAYVVNLGCVDLNPHAVRTEDLDRPDELRIDLDPVPGVEWPQIVEVAQVARDVLEERGLVGWPKTSGSRGVHIWVRIHPRWPFSEVRRAAVALAREVERRAPAIATARWWKEERHGVFLDYNQNARDRTTASAYSVRPTPDARVSMPLSWADFLRCDPAAYTLRTVPALVAAHGDAHAGIDDAVGALDGLLALADQQAEQGQVDAPWPPHFAKGEQEAPRVAPSRARSPRSRTSAAAGAAPRRGTLPVITIAQAKLKPDALAGLERWKARHPELTAQLAAEDILVDTNRGRSSAWYRVRINLQHIAEAERPPQATPDPDYDPRTEFAGRDEPEGAKPPRAPGRAARKARAAPASAPAPEGTVEGTVQGTLEGTGEGTAEGAAEGNAEGTVESAAEGNAEAEATTERSAAPAPARGE